MNRWYTSGGPRPELRMTEAELQAEVEKFTEDGPTERDKAAINRGKEDDVWGSPDEIDWDFDSSDPWQRVVHTDGDSPHFHAA